MSKVFFFLIKNKKSLAHIQTGSIRIWIDLASIFVYNDPQLVFCFPVLEIVSKFQLLMEFSSVFQLDSVFSSEFVLSCEIQATVCQCWCFLQDSGLFCSFPVSFWTVSMFTGGFCPVSTGFVLVSAGSDWFLAGKVQFRPVLLCFRPVQCCCGQFWRFFSLFILFFFAVVLFFSQFGGFQPAQFVLG